MWTRRTLLLSVAVAIAWCSDAAFGAAGPAAPSKAQPTLTNLKEMDEADMRLLRQKSSRVLEDKEYAEDYSFSSWSSYSSNGYALGTNFFADTTENSYYDGYQQAWRYLGHLVKCGYPSSRYDQEDSHSGSGSGDENRWRGNNYCQRYLVWAAYVDLDYEGGGIGEYYYPDPYSDDWDYSACETHPSSSGRCVPMDCHFSNTTTWTLMGVYKEAEYFGNDAFFEQLFKHEGVCVWNDDDLYEFMSDAREADWPEGCVQTYSYVSDADDSGDISYIYLDLKPTYNGNMTYGLYTDEVCKYEYRGSQVSVETVAESMELLYGDYLYQWNEALEVYKVCQPCMAYNLQNDYQADDYVNDDYYNNGGDDDDGGGGDDGGGQYDAQSYGGDNAGDDGGGGYNNWWNWWSNRRLGRRDRDRRRDRRTDRRHLDGYMDYADSDPNEGYFQCDDDAGYTNVNQCMKFRSHADLEVASWEDLVIATEQGGILEVNVSGNIFGTARMTYEEQLYKEELLRMKEAKEEAEYQALVASVPSTAPFTAAGILFAVVGSLALLSAIVWAFRGPSRKRRTATVTQMNLKEPLVEPTT